MAIINAGAELNFDTLRLGALGDRLITNYSSTFAQAEGGGVTDRYWGNFVFNGAGELVGGTITQFSQTSNGVTLLHLYDASVSVVDVAFGMLNDISLGQLPIFGGADLITGSWANDLIRSQGGDDRVYGDGGADTVFAGTGNDTVWGGEGRNYLRGDEGSDSLTGGGAVSYTHLTLPTKRIV